MTSVKRSYSVTDFYNGSGKAAMSRQYSTPTAGAGGDHKYTSKYGDSGNAYGDTYTARRRQESARKHTSYSLNKPISLYDTPGGLRRTFSSCKIIQSKEAKKSLIQEYIKDYCVYRLQLTPDKEYIPTPNILVNSCWNTLDDARDPFSATICVSLFKKDSKEHKKMQKLFKNCETPARYKLRLQKFLKGPMDASLSQIRLSKLSDMEKLKIFRSMLERVFQEQEARNENMYEDVDSVNTWRGGNNNKGEFNRQKHYMQVTLNEIFSIRKLERLFIIIARHCCFYACIKMDFMVKSIMSEAAEFLVDSLIFDWMMSKLGGTKGWAQVYDMEKEIAAGRAKPPTKAKNPGQKGYAKSVGGKAIYGQIKERDESHVSRTSSGVKNRQKHDPQTTKKKPTQKMPEKETGCSCLIL